MTARIATAARTAMAAITAMTRPQLRRRVSGTRAGISCGVAMRTGDSDTGNTSVGVENISVSGSGVRSMICVEPASKPGAV